MISQTETAGAGNQYGFYAIPKAVQPKKKYRDSADQEYQDQPEQDDLNAFATIEDRKPVNQRQLQRDFYVDEAPYPEFKPRERGLDYGVQIERGDLFDFELEVKPLLQILVGRSVVSAINELQEEKEKEERRNNLDKYQKKRNAELMVTQRLEAKHKRKLEEAERRKLQKELYVKNQKEAGKKIIARRNAKESLLGLRNDLLNELQDEGYLRSDPTGDLKINYEEWLYGQIISALHFAAEGQAAAERLVAEEEARLAQEHRRCIEEEMGRRQAILNERERLRLQDQARKQKKRIKKMRKRLNAEREPDFIRFDQLMQRHEQVTNILKFADRSNGFSNDFAARSALYVAGGIDNFILALLQASEKDLSAQEIEAMLVKIITESGRQLQFSLLGEHYERVQQVRKRMEEEKAEFMRDKDNQVRALAQEISLDLSFLEANNLPLKSKLLNNFLQAVLSIVLTTRPEPSQENPFQLPDKEKKRLQQADKIRLNKQDETFLQRLQKIDRILRIHFQILRSQEQSQRSKSEQEEGEDWIDIYDGQWWTRSKKEEKKPVDRATQQAAALTLNGFENSFVVDERVSHYLQAELEKLLDVTGGQKFGKYVENVANIQAKIKKNIPVFDGEVRSN